MASDSLPLEYWLFRKDKNSSIRIQIYELEITRKTLVMV